MTGTEGASPLDESTLARVLEEGARLWNAGRFFECHDALEEAWRALKREKKAEAAADPRRDFVHGIILWAAAYVHWTRGNALGVGRKLADARSVLRSAPDRAWGLELGPFRARVEADLERGAAGQPFVLGSAPRWPNSGAKGPRTTS